MQAIRNLSIEDLLTKLKEHKLCPSHETLTVCKRKAFEKQLFLQVSKHRKKRYHNLVRTQIMETNTFYLISIFHKYGVQEDQY